MYKTVVVFEIAKEGGRLSETGRSVGGMPSAMCLLFVAVDGGPRL